MKRKRYAIVGAGSRGASMFAKPLATEFRKSAEVVAIMDTNASRAAYAAGQLPFPVPTFTDFGSMMDQTDPDCVIVASRDCQHAEYITRTLKAGKRAVTEKPLCISAKQCRDILKVARDTGGTCFTTHNARYGSDCTTIRRIIRSGVLGDILWMQFDETLDKHHGGDYFRRWHRNKANSGGLQIHKASHHFDLLNWWTSSKPVRVTAEGGLRFYGKNNPFHGKRCRGCKYARKCTFYSDVTDPRYGDLEAMYVNAEHEDGYYRDSCVWDPSIDIEDQLAVHIDYANGVQVAYTLVAYAAVESMRVIIEGTKARLEAFGQYGTGWSMGGKKCRLPNLQDYCTHHVRLMVPPKPIHDVPLKTLRGGHGGADPLLMRDLFARDWKLAPNEMMASLDQAVQAILIGAAVNKSLATGKAVDVQSLLKND